MRDLSRRNALGLIAAVSIPPTAFVAVAAAAPSTPSIDEFLAVALPAEKARYHANALADAMAEMHPHRSWRSHVNHESYFCLIVGDAIDTGSPDGILSSAGSVLDKSLPVDNGDCGEKV